MHRGDPGEVESEQWEVCQSYRIGLKSVKFMKGVEFEKTFDIVSK